MTESAKQVIIFGGSFSPPTLAHEAIIEQCLKQPEADEVWVMPSGTRLDKDIQVSDEHRLNMLEAVKRGSFNNNPRLNMSDFELHLPRPSHTARTAGALALAHPDTHFWFVFGADSYATMPSWPDGQAMLRELSMLVVPRAGLAVPAESERLRILNNDARYQKAISSTAVRRAVAEEASLAELVSPAVEVYIQTHGLYMTQKASQISYT